MNLLRIAARVAGVDITPPAGWIYFHLSSQDLGPKFNFTPSVPHDAFEDPNEDFTTKRISLAPTLEGCVMALPSGGDFFIYGTKSSNFFKPKKSPFDYEDWEEYAEKNKIDPSDEKARAKVLKGCVPDPETGEVWSTKPITLQKLGIISAPEGTITSVKWENI